jgi:hypothetical protein
VPRCEQSRHCFYGGLVIGLVLASQVNLFFDVIRGSPGITNVCEVGFNAGHSALAWLSAVPGIKVLSFDLGAHQYVRPAYEVIDRMYVALPVT